MCEKQNKQYYNKMLYLNAVKAIYNDSYYYFSKYIIPLEYKKISDYITEKPLKSSVTILKDSFCCCDDFLLKALSQQFKNKYTVAQIFCDLFGFEKLKAIYIFELDFLCISFRECEEYDYTLESCYVSKCYYRNGKNQKNYMDLADEFFEKSNFL